MILVAVGANLAASDGRAPHQSCLDAVGAIGRLSGLRIAAVSAWYRSTPVPASDQPDYVNGMVRLHAAGDEPDPAALLFELQRIEHDAGRVRSVRDAARPLDLDIVAMGRGGALRRERPDPVLPHPRTQQRAFVLLPLRDVAPDWTDPASGQSVDALLAALPATALHASAISRIGRDGA